MKVLYFASVLCLFLIIDDTYGEFDGMLSCAWGKNKHGRSKRGSLSRQGSTNYAISENDVKFFLYNKENPYPYQLFLNDESRLTSGNFDPKKLTKIIIHGYRSTYKSSSCVLPRDAFLKSGDFNIIVVDWNRAQFWGINHAFPTAYPTVVKKLPDVAALVKDMIHFLADNGMDLKTTQIVGHSLGAHIAGIVGYNLRTKIHRIVGLDPAAPYFSDKEEGERLSKEAATYVEVIHSEIEECGLKNQLGHYDFYPNGGKLQPGCTTNKCSHSRSYRYFAESLGSTIGFYGRKCADWQSMQAGKCDGEIVMMGGLDRDTIPEGIYFVETNDKAPFAKGKLN